jgi:Calcineurin-like phosphoesterase
MPPPVPRTIVIGDVHGCLDELKALLRATGADGASDRIVLVGDLVAKGPDSQGVVQACREGGFNAVLGNHDAKVLSLETSFETSREAPTTHQKVAESLGPKDWAYLTALPLWLRLPELGVVVVHAGLVPGVALEAQRRNCLLNLRSITKDGMPSTKVREGRAWASLWRGPEHVVFGHDAVRGLQQYDLATGLDTGCVYGRRLTALVLPERRLVSVPARSVYAPI